MRLGVWREARPTANTSFARLLPSLLSLLNVQATGDPLLILRFQGNEEGIAEAKQ